MNRTIEFHPAWDRRDPDPKKDYGVSGVDIAFYVKGELGAVQFLLYTGWLLPETLGLAGDPSVHGDMFRYSELLAAKNRGLSFPMPADLGYHSPKPMYEDHTPISVHCDVLDGPCYYDGSSLNAERPFSILLSEGSDGVFNYLEGYYQEVFE